MKISLALGKREGLSLQTARGCVGTNIALPGFGSILAGRAVGYAQAAVTVVSFLLTTVCGMRFVFWCLANWSRIYGPDADPMETMISIWVNVRWAFLGIALFGVVWLWALVTNAVIVREARKTEASGKPPKLA